MRFTVRQLADALGARLGGDAELAGEITVDGVSIDSRSAHPGNLFVPIVAERDGHRFIDAARAAGVRAWLTHPSQPGAGETGAIVVNDTSAALLRIGAAARDRLPDTVVGVTGSSGKTSTKDLLASVLRVRGSATANEESFNNELGVPLTLAGAPEGSWAAVIEMGARGKGHIAQLCEIARPTIGVITNIGTAHRELFADAVSTADAKAELLDALGTRGTAILNADDAQFAYLRGRARCTVLRFSENPGADIAASAVRLSDDLRPAFRLMTPLGTADVLLPVRGAHQVQNALAAAGAATALGMRADEIAEGLSTATGSAWRMELLETPTGARLINDAYNANPSSMRAGLEALAAMPASRRIALLGTMAELGTDSDDLHAAIAELAHALGITVIGVGTRAYGTDHSFRSVDGVDEAVNELGPVGAGDAILVKGSRSAGLERLAHRLAEGAPA